MSIFNYEDKRILAIYKDFDGDITKTAKKTGLSESSIRMRMSRVRKKRKTLFEDLSFIRKYNKVLKPKKSSDYSEEPVGVVAQ